MRTLFQKMIFLLIFFLSCTWLLKVSPLSAQNIDPPPLPRQDRRPKMDAPPPPPVLELTNEQKSVLMDYIKQFYPARYEKLKEIEINSPNLFDEAISKHALNINELRRMRNKNPERYNRIFKERQIDDKSYLLAQAYKKEASEEEKIKIREDLKKVLYKQFEDRQKIREEEMLRLEKRLQELKENLDKRQEKLDAIVEERLKKLLELEKELKW